MTEVLLGFEIGSGEPVYMKQAHTVALGMTQHGKTTTLEAIIDRTPNAKALAFKTKRGEAGFNNYRNVQPYYKSRADWKYVESLLNVALSEKVQYQPFMRWAILQVTKGHPTTLRQVLNNSIACQDKYPRRKEVFEQLTAYLELVVPELEKHTFSTTLELAEGVNVMDISDMGTETQYLVIAASIEYIHDNLEGVIVIVPEAWESIPQGRTTPVKIVAEKFIRKGAAIGNFLYLDSQDIGGIDKQPLRQCDNWIMGRMKEAHEVDRLIDQLQGVKVAKAETFQTLPLGTFYAVLGNDVKKVYVLPAGVPQQMGIDVATGKISPEVVKDFLKSQKKEDSDLVYKEMFDREQEKTKDLNAKVEALLAQVQKLSEQIIPAEKLEAIKNEADLNGYSRGRADAESESREPTFDEAAQKIFSKDFLEHLSQGVQVGSQSNGNKNIALEDAETAITVTETGPRYIELSTDKSTGKILLCVIEMASRAPAAEQSKTSFLSADIQKEALEHGWNIPNKTMGGALLSMVRDGLLVKEDNKYRLPSKAKISAK